MVKIGKVGKQKTKSTAKKRIGKTGSGKLRIGKASHNHLLLQKSTRQKNKARKNGLVENSEVKTLKRMGI